MSKSRNLAFGLGAIVASTFTLTSTSWAAIPAGYTGTPHGGTARAIPGRINLVDYDDGGDKVAFDVDHNGDVPCAGYDYRTDKPTPVLCKTSAGENDKFTAGPNTGMPFPSAGASDYYVGAIRPNDWVQVTVDVKQAGTYVLSTDWASDAGQIHVKISFNGVMKVDYTRNGTGGYHNWVPGPAFATVQLDAGLQVMRYQSVIEHVNMNYVSFALQGDPTGTAGTGGGAAGTGGGTAGTSGGAAGTSGAGGTTGAAGTSGAAGTTGAAGTSATSGAAGTSGRPSTDDDAGCACTFGGSRDGRSGAGTLLLALSGVGLLAARRRRR